MTVDTRGFLDMAGGFQRADPARNPVMLTVTEDLRVTAASAGTLFGWWQPDGEPVGAAFMHTPDYPVMLSTASVQAAGALARDLTAGAGAGRRIPGLNAGQEAADAFAAAWRDRTGDAVAVSRRMRLFRLGERLGYHPVEDRVMLSFAPARHRLRFIRERTRGFRPARRR